MREMLGLLGWLFVLFPVPDVLLGRIGVWRCLVSDGHYAWAFIYAAAWSMAVSLLMLDRLRQSWMNPEASVFLRQDPSGEQVLSVRISVARSRSSIPPVRMESFAIHVSFMDAQMVAIRRSAVAATMSSIDGSGDAMCCFSFVLSDDEAKRLLMVPLIRATVVAEGGIAWSRGGTKTGWRVDCPLQRGHAWKSDMEADHAAS